MQLSVTSDFVDSHDDPVPYLHEIRSAGFTRVHFCHEWDSDHIYPPDRIAAIRNEMIDLGMSSDIVHASEGQQIGWGLDDPTARDAGIDLVKNRIDLAVELGADTIVLHARAHHSEARQKESLGALLPYADSAGVTIALENLPKDGFSRVFPLLDEFQSDVLGFCFDSGHAALNRAHGFDDFADAERRGDRLAALHLHDNDGASDQHRLPFTGVVDWDRIARMIAASPFAGCLTLEVMLRNESHADHASFLAAAREAGRKLDEMVAASLGSAPDAGGGR